MITAHPYGVQECQSPIPASQGQPYRQPSTVALREGPQGFAGQALSAMFARTALRSVYPFLRVSQSELFNSQLCLEAIRASIDALGFAKGGNDAVGRAVCAGHVPPASHEATSCGNGLMDCENAIFGSQGEIECHGSSPVVEIKLGHNDLSVNRRFAA